MGAWFVLPYMLALVLVPVAIIVASVIHETRHSDPNVGKGYVRGSGPVPTNPPPPKPRKSA